MKHYRVTVLRNRMIRVPYTVEMTGIEAESEVEARRPGRIGIAQAPWHQESAMAGGDPESTIDPPEILDVVDQDELLAHLHQLQEDSHQA